MFLDYLAKARESSADLRSGEERRHPLYESVPQRGIKGAFGARCRRDNRDQHPRAEPGRGRRLGVPVRVPRIACVDGVGIDRESGAM